MITCQWCGTNNKDDASNCAGCGAPLGTNTPIAVVVDVTAIKGRVNVDIKQLKAFISELIPGARFAMRFNGNTVTLVPTDNASANKGGGATAIGKGAVAVAQGGIHIGGSVNGASIVVGNNNKSTVNSSAQPKEEKPEQFAVWLPKGVHVIVVSGNGETKVNCQYPDAEFDSLGTID